MTILPNEEPLSPRSSQPLNLTIEECKKRQKRKEEKRLTAIHKTQKPKHKRAEKLGALRKELADLIWRVSDPNHILPWELNGQLWQRIHAIEKQLQKEKRKRQTKKQSSK